VRDTIDMAREAGSEEYGPLTRNWSFELTQLKAFEALVRADEREEYQRWFVGVITQHKQLILAEREACAKVCEELPLVEGAKQMQRATLKDAAAAIRARGQA